MRRSSSWLDSEPALGALALGLSSAIALGVYALSGLILRFGRWALLASLAALPALWIAIALYDWIVLAAFLAFSIVHVEPAPSDILFVALLPLGLISGRLRPDGLRGLSWVHLALWFYVILSMTSLITGTASFGIDRINSQRFMLITFFLIAFYYFVVLYVDRPRRMKLVLLGYLASGLFAAGLTIAARLLGGRFSFLVTDPTIRAQAFFEDPNVFGAFLIPLVLFLFEDVRASNLIRGRAGLKWSMILILFMALFLSFSRGAWGAMLFGLGVYWALGLHRQTWWRLSLVILAAVVLAVIVIVVILQTQALSGFLESRLQLATYDSLRFARQLEGLQIGLTNILGQGPGRLGRAHSLYAREFAGLGILGLVTISGFLFASSGSMVVLARRDNTPVWGLSPAVLAASLLAVMFQSFVIDTIHWRHFWLLLALAAVVHRAGATSGSIENAA